MPTKTEICNLALRRVRGDPIDDLDTSTTTEGLECQILYPLTRDFLLASYDWRFAHKTLALALSTDPSPNEWVYTYDYPNDCLRASYLVPPWMNDITGLSSTIPMPQHQFEPIEYEVGMGSDGGTRIWTNMSDAVLAYTAKIEDTNQYDPLFVEMLAWKLAYELAIPLGGDSGQRYRDTAMQAFSMAEQRAWAKSANEANRGFNRMPNSIQARAGYNPFDQRIDQLFWNR